MVTLKRPEVGKIENGQRVWVVFPYSRHRDRPDRLGTVTKVGRVWITVEPDGHGREIRFRIDTQNEGDGIHYQHRFATIEQYVFDQRVNAARAKLRAAGITFQYGSRWNTVGGMFRLAELIGDVDEEEMKAWDA